jgi:hypothetical protein
MGLLIPVNGLRSSSKDDEESRSPATAILCQKGWASAAARPTAFLMEYEVYRDCDPVDRVSRDLTNLDEVEPV